MYKSNMTGPYSFLMQNFGAVDLCQNERQGNLLGISERGTQ